MQTLPAIVTLAAYNVLLLGIGIWFARRSGSEDTFLLGGRSLGPVVAGIAYAASSSSAWVLLGFSGFVYAAGPSALWMVPGILGGYVAVWFWAGRVLQDSSRERGHLTLTDFLTEFASPATARAIRIAASLMIAFLYAFYVAAQFQGAGIALDDLLGIGLSEGVVIGAAVILAYTFLGGYLAVSVTDTLQGLLMACVAVVLPATAFIAAGGWNGLSEGLSLAEPTYVAGFGGRTGWIAAGFVTGLFATGFAALGQPHLLAWIMGVKDRRSRITGGCVAIGWACLVFTGMGILGLSGRAIFGADAPPEGVFFSLAGELLPGILAGVIVAATLSAIMSTVDSQLLVAGGAVSHDLRLGEAFGGRPVLVSRLVILGLCLAAVGLTLVLPSTIFDRTLFAWTALGASFGPTVVVRAMGMRPNGAGVLTSVLAGFATSLVFEFVLPPGPGAVWSRTIPWIAAFAGLWAGAKLGAGRDNRVSPLGEGG